MSQRLAYLNVRIEPTLRDHVRACAHDSQQTVNAWVKEALMRAVLAHNFSALAAAIAADTPKKKP